jgi:ubiquinone/menaquinone biosynthesis C-methylase UbiE
MRLRSVRKAWETFGRDDPLWAVLTDPANRDGGADVEAFFATGVLTVEQLLGMVKDLGATIPPGRALDFGCGVGRLTQALALHFDEVHGVDLSAPMVEEARARNTMGERCQFHVNTAPDLSLFPNEYFAFALTMLVLQHNPRGVIGRYIAEFGRVLQPGGIAIIEIPSGRDARAVTERSHRLPPMVRSAIVRTRQRLTGRPAMLMSALPSNSARQMFSRAGLEIVHEVGHMAAGWRQVAYVVRRTV